MHNHINLRIGDKLVQQKMGGLWQHVGVVIGPDCVLHNTLEKGEHSTTVTDFSGGKPFQVVETDADPVTVVTRARKILANPQTYGVFTRNCEDTVYEVLIGKPVSPQGQTIIIVGLCLAFGAFFLSQRSK